MTEPDERNDDLDATLRKQRPAAPREFATGLRRHLMAQDSASRRPARLWLLVYAYLCSGAVLLVLAALGAFGSGPFGS